MFLDCCYTLHWADHCWKWNSITVTRKFNHFLSACHTCRQFYCYLSLILHRPCKQPYMVVFITKLVRVITVGHSFALLHAHKLSGGTKTQNMETECRKQTTYRFLSRYRSNLLWQSIYKSMVLDMPLSLVASIISLWVMCPILWCGCGIQKLMPI